MIYLVNLSEKDFIRKKNKWLPKIKEWVDKHDPGAIIIPFSGAFEQTLAEKDDLERKEYEEEVKCKSQLDKIIVTGYKALQLEYFFTAGVDEVKAWTIQVICQTHNLYYMLMEELPCIYYLIFFLERYQSPTRRWPDSYRFRERFHHGWGNALPRL